MTHDLGYLIGGAMFVGLALAIVALPIVFAYFGTKGGRS